MPTDAERIKELERLLNEEKQKNSHYERNGAAKLFYALNRKSSEMADLLNKQSLANLDLTDAKDKSFERLKIAWNEAAGIATAVDTLGRISGVTGDEEKDTKNSKFRITPESMAQSVGDIKTQQA